MEIEDTNMYYQYRTNWYGGRKMDKFNLELQVTLDNFENRRFKIIIIGSRIHGDIWRKYTEKKSN